MASLTTGNKTRVTFGSIVLKEVSVTPMGITLDPSIEQTSNANIKFNSLEPGDNQTKTPLSLTCKYNINDVVALYAEIGVKQLITITYSDGSTKADIGWVVSFAPDALTVNVDPSATIGIDWEGESDAGVDSLVITPSA